MMAKIELSDGKYTVIDELSEGGGFRALRYGEEWRDLAGDNLIYSMFCEIERLRSESSYIEEVRKLREELEYQRYQKQRKEFDWYVGI